MVDAVKRHSRSISRPALETLLLAGLAVVGAGLIAGVLWIGGWVKWGHHARGHPFDKPAWWLWLALLAAEGALWGILLPLVLRAHATLRAGLNRRDLVVALGPLVVLSIGADVLRWLSRSARYSPLTHHFAKTTVIAWLGTVFALVAVAGMVRVGRAAWASDFGTGDEAALAHFVQLRASLRQFLFSAGAAVGGAALTIGALEQALGKHGHPQLAFAYGIFLSALLAAAYAPAFAAVQRAGERLLDAIDPPPAKGDPDWPVGSTRRGQVRAFLGLDVDFVQSLRVGVAVLAPLASGFVSLLLPS